MKAKKFVFVKTRLDSTAEKWGKVLFSNESTVQKFASHKCLVRRPFCVRFKDYYTIKNMNHP